MEEYVGVVVVGGLVQLVAEKMKSKDALPASFAPTVKVSELAESKFMTTQWFSSESRELAPSGSVNVTVEGPVETTRFVAGVLESE